MTHTRYRTRTILFRHPFRLPNMDTDLAPGAYSVDEEYAEMEGTSFPVYRRITTVLHLRTTGSVKESIEVDGTALDAALLDDATSGNEFPGKEGS